MRARFKTGYIDTLALRQGVRQQVKQREELTNVMTQTRNKNKNKKQSPSILFVMTNKVAQTITREKFIMRSLILVIIHTWIERNQRDMETCG